VIAEPRPSAFWMLARMAAWGNIAEIDVDPTTDVYVDRADRSWAVLDYEDATITQGGPRRLWDAAVELHQNWSALGRPDRDRLGLTVTAQHRQYVWLDDPGSGRRWNLACVLRARGGSRSRRLLSTGCIPRASIAEIAFEMPPRARRPEASMAGPWLRAGPSVAASVPTVAGWG
jgi:hypothetical protein